MDSWWLDEMTTAGAEHLDDSYVAGYDQKAQFDPGQDIDALRALGLDETSVVIDLGAGTGVFAVAAAMLGASVTAVDVSPAMVGALRQNADALELPNLQVVQAGFLSYRHQGPPVDVVFSRNALHQLPDFWKVVALRKIARMLQPNGLLRLSDLVFDLGPDEIESSIASWMSAAAPDPARGYTAAEFAAHVRSEFSTFSWLFEPMLAHTGFAVIDRNLRKSVYATYTCRKMP